MLDGKEPESYQPGLRHPQVGPRHQPSARCPSHRFRVSASIRWWKTGFFLWKTRTWNPSQAVHQVLRLAIGWPQDG